MKERGAPALKQWGEQETWHFNGGYQFRLNKLQKWFGVRYTISKLV